MRPRELTLRAAIVGGLAVAALGLASCGHSSQPVEISAQAGTPDPSTTETTQSDSTSTVTAPSSTSTTETSTSTALTTSTTAVPVDPITAATAAITKALVDDGHTPTYAACVVSTAASQFSGNEAVFVAGALALGHPTDSGPVDQLKAIPLTDAEKADVPDHMQAVYNLCASSDIAQQG
jgi:hypothetical protein